MQERGQLGRFGADQRRDGGAPVDDVRGGGARQEAQGKSKEEVCGCRRP